MGLMAHALNLKGQITQTMYSLQNSPTNLYIFSQLSLNKHPVSFVSIDKSFNIICVIFLSVNTVVTLTVRFSEHPEVKCLIYILRGVKGQITGDHS